MKYLCWQGQTISQWLCSQAGQGLLVTPSCTCSFLHEPFHSLDLSLNEAITLWVVWWWSGVSNTKTCKKLTEFFAIKGRAIVTHDLLRCAFYTEQVHQVGPLSWQSWLSWPETRRGIYWSNHRSKYTTCHLCRNSPLWSSSRVPVAHCELAMALWEVETGVYILGTSLCNLWCLHPALANIGVDGRSVGLLWLRDDLGGAFEVTPHRGRMEWLFWCPSRAVSHRLITGLWSPSMPWPSRGYASFDVAIPAESAGTLCQEWGLPS